MVRKRDKVAALLIQKGFEEIQSNSRKYRRFTSNRPDHFFFLGKAAGLRYGRNVSTSRSVETIKFLGIDLI